MHWLRGRGSGAFISVEAGRSPDAERTVRALTRRLKSNLVQRQRRAGMRWGLLATVFEALGRDRRPKFNAHVIVVMPDVNVRDRLIESLHRSSVYAGRVYARPVDEWNRLTAYLLKEATPQAWFGAGKSFRRIRGTIPLGDLGGDRVVLSRDLRDVLIASGRIAPFKRTYAKRQRRLNEIAEAVTPPDPPARPEPDMAEKEPVRAPLIDNAIDAAEHVSRANLGRGDARNRRGPMTGTIKSDDRITFECGRPMGPAPNLEF
jgi:hypothetical protein